MISNFIYRKDSLQEIVKKELDLNKDRDPHNNRNRIPLFFNLLWSKGYNPELSYLCDSGDINLREDEAFRYYGKRIPGLEEPQFEAVKEIIAKTSIEGAITITYESSMALLVWKV